MQPKFKILFSILLLIVSFFILSSTPIASAIDAENRFTVQKDGTVKDHKNKLIWPPRDNSYDINWYAAMSYSQSYSFGGHSDWRVPSSEELATLYVNRAQIPGQTNTDMATTLIKITGAYIWTGTKKANHKAMAYDVNSAISRRLHREHVANSRVLPVRSAP